MVAKLSESPDIRLSKAGMSAEVCQVFKIFWYNYLNTSYFHSNNNIFDVMVYNIHLFVPIFSLEKFSRPGKTDPILAKTKINITKF